MPSLLIIELHWEGYNMRYVAWISGEATRLGYEVWLATSGSFFEHPLYQEIQRKCNGGIKEVGLPAEVSYNAPHVPEVTERGLASVDLTKE